MKILKFLLVVLGYYVVLGTVYFLGYADAKDKYNIEQSYPIKLLPGTSNWPEPNRLERS